MKALWRAGRGASVHQVRAELGVGPERDYRTIQTILHRCHEKGWVKLERDGGRCYYSAALPQDRAAEERTREFLRELAEGEPAVLEAAQRALDRERKALRGR